MNAFELSTWLFWRLALLSPLAFGAGIAVSPELHRLLVGDTSLLTEAQFIAAIALGQAAPGPNLIYVPLLGFELAGLPGALAALSGFLLPSGTAVIYMARLGVVHGHRLAVRALRTGLPPMTIGLLMSAGWLIAPGTGQAGYLALTLVGALVMWLTRIHLLWLILAGAVAGMAIG